MSHIFEKVDGWESSIAKSVDKRIPQIKKQETSRSKIAFIVMTVGITGVIYSLFAIGFKSIATSLLVSLYLILQLIIPILYFVFVVLFGVASSVTTYHNVFNLMGVETSDRLWLSDIMNALPAVFVVACLLTVYLSFVYYFARQYYKTIWSSIRNDRSA